MTGNVFLKDEGLGRTGVSGGCSEDLVLCRVGSVGELVALRLCVGRVQRAGFKGIITITGVAGLL